MITPAFGITATERVLPKLALDFTTASLDPRITFTRTTGASNPATYTDSSGVITAATNNQPRFDYDPVTLVCKGLLIEESRTNSLLNTDLLSTQIVTVTAAVRTLSFYGTGSVTLSGAHTAVVSGTGAYPTRTTYSFTPTAGALTLTVAGTVQYAQLEAGAFATSYIPTTTAALTRNADVATMTGTNFSDWFNASEGTLLGFGATGTGSAGAPTFLSLDDGTTNNRFILRRRLNDTQVNLRVVSASGSIDNSNTTGTPGAVHKIAGAYKTNDQMAASDTVLMTGIVSLATLPTCTQLQLGVGPGSGYWNGHIQEVMYWPQRLTNAELQAFTK